MASIEEQETVVNFSRTDKIATIWTSDTTVMTRLDKAEIWKCVKEEYEADTHKLFAKEYQAPKNMVSFRSKIKTINMTDEQRKSYSERLKGYWRNKSAEFDENKTLKDYTDNIQ